MPVHDLAIGEVFEMQELSTGKNPVSRGAMNENQSKKSDEEAG